MPSSDYTGVTSGALKLKGSAGIDKKRKKKKSKPISTDATSANPTDLDKEQGKEQAKGKAVDIQAALADEDELDQEEGKELEKDPVGRRQKTEAERRHEERKRKRLDERLKREGIKTHKERVEELNRYLSNLSEHHDMPRIGPG
ncbi:DUF1754-domain-containing protein [Glonium stellatum]|uniref:DUF1754-domain-containing protein n=1 Tax=Glonium stellatum TaxID=574774 RepID=A0A8E2FDS8_9PEZI|nr:DUF1754-domain-containing protein [Glonium stellatum]